MLREITIDGTVYSINQLSIEWVQNTLYIEQTPFLLRKKQKKQIFLYIAPEIWEWVRNKQKTLQIVIHVLGFLGYKFYKIKNTNYYDILCGKEVLYRIDLTNPPKKPIKL